MDEMAIRRRIEELLTVPESTANEPAHQLFQGALTLLAATYGPESPQVKSLEQLGRSNRGTYAMIRAGAARGALQSLRGDLEAGLVGSLRTRMAGTVIADFLAAARAALEESGKQAKNVAAVLAAAIYEDTIRRMGSELAGVSDRPKLAAVLEELKDRGILVGAQFGVAQSYLQFRNDALHADWDRVERESVASVLGFVEQLLLKHFS